MKHTLPTGLGLLAVWSALSFSNYGQADSWLPPSEFDTPSENGKFNARIIPGKRGAKPLLIVSAVSSGKTNKPWQIELSNDVSPSRVFLAQDGLAVVTLDNWGGIGYGDDVVAIYNQKGQLAKYSLEQIAPPPKPKSNPSGWRSYGDGYEGKFSHSTSSRHWRENSIEFFYEDAHELLFCLWLDWDDRWALWRMSDGRIVPVTADLTKRLNVEGRARALKEAQTGSFASAALNFLGRQHFKEDRPLVEAWLDDKDFCSGSMTSSSSDPPHEVFAFTARSYRRETADKILSRWNGVSNENTGLGSLDKYKFLGNLKGSIALPVAPAKGEGTIHVYLIPETKALSEWDSVRPEHYLTARLAHSYPYVFDNGQVRDGKLSNTVNFIIYGVTPGRYRLKAVWDKVQPFAAEGELPCKPHKGDFESTTSSVVSIRKGVDTAGVRIECTQLVTE